ncbi:MAG: AI-2E family transporter [Clostridia bacterium]|nr:AI-2E family transporter [Clostridia bacterium]
MIKDKYRNYWNWGVTVFLIILCSFFAFFFMLRYSQMSAFLRNVGGILSPILLGMAIAYIMAPIADNIERLLARIQKKPSARLDKFYRMLSTVVSVFILIAIITFIVGTILPQVISGIRQLISNFDLYVGTVEAWLMPRLQALDPAISQAVDKYINDIEANLRSFLENDLLSVLSRVTAGVVEMGRMIYNFLLGIIVSIYFMNARESIVARCKKVIYAIFKLRISNKIVEVIRQTDNMFRGFIMGKVLDSSIIGVICFAGMSLMAMPYTLLISVVIGVTNIIPYFGPFIGAIPSILLILLTDPLKALIFAVFILVLQQIDGNVIGPKILGNTTGLSSLGVLIAILIGGGLFGVLGMIISVPAVGVIYSFVKRSMEIRLRKGKLPTKTDSYVDLAGINPQTLEPTYENYRQATHSQKNKSSGQSVEQ